MVHLIESRGNNPYGRLIDQDGKRVMSRQRSAGARQLFGYMTEAAWSCAVVFIFIKQATGAPFLVFRVAGATLAVLEFKRLYSRNKKLRKEHTEKELFRKKLASIEEEKEKIKNTPVSQGNSPQMRYKQQRRLERIIAKNIDYSQLLAMSAILSAESDGFLQLFRKIDDPEALAQLDFPINNKEWSEGKQAKYRNALKNLLGVNSKENGTFFEAYYYEAKRKAISQAVLTPLIVGAFLSFVYMGGDLLSASLTLMLMGNILEIYDAIRALDKLEKILAIEEIEVEPFKMFGRKVSLDFTQQASPPNLVLARERA